MGIPVLFLDSMKISKAESATLAIHATTVTAGSITRISIADLRYTKRLTVSSRKAKLIDTLHRQR
jgi:hypothetical protein